MVVKGYLASISQPSTMHFKYSQTLQYDEENIIIALNVHLSLQGRRKNCQDAKRERIRGRTTRPVSGGGAAVVLSLSHQSIWGYFNLETQKTSRA